MFLKAPISKHKYLFEQSMFETIWIIYSYLAVFFLGLSIKHFVYNNPNLFTFIGAFLMTVGALIILKRVGKYYVPAAFGVFFGTVFCQYSVLFIADYSGIPDLLWVILISLFAFYSLGSKWGVTVLFLNIS